MNNITVIGVGKLGLGLALLIDKGGYNVCGVDVFPTYVDSLNRKEYRTKEPHYEDMLKTSKHFRATTSLEEGLNHSDIIFIVVQTPNSGGENFYDHHILSNLLCKINDYKVQNKHIIIGCTVMPKYIDTIGKQLICDCHNTTLSYNPEFVAQGEVVRGFLHPDIILIGTESELLSAKLKEIYGSFIQSNPKYCVLTPLESEVVKISLNGFITTKLSFANMISDACDSLGANKHAVLDSIGADSRVGNKYFRAGYSFGGPCFPRDTRALNQFLNQNGINGDLLTATTRYNEEHIVFQAKQLLAENREEYVFENVCYKEKCEIPLIEESAKLKIAKYIANKGKPVIIRDHKETIDEVKKEYGNIFSYNIVQRKKYLINIERTDGFGAQFQSIIFYILYAELNGLEFAYRPITDMEHNYDNDPNFIVQINEFINIIDNFSTISNVNMSDVVDIPSGLIYNTVENSIVMYTDNNPSLNKIKNCFWKTKDRNVFKNNRINVAVHIRRPNIHDNRIEGCDTNDTYYLAVINSIRTKYCNKNLIFHIYSQGEIANFECYKNEDTELHINESVTSTFLGLVGAEILVMSRSSFSYSAALLSDGEVYYLPFWHRPKQSWIVVDYNP